jgi:hypothetical protein
MNLHLVENGKMSRFVIVSMSSDACGQCRRTIRSPTTDVSGGFTLAVWTYVGLDRLPLCLRGAMLRDASL